MSCRASLGEEVDDDDRAFLEGAQNDVSLAATLLMCLSRRERYSPSWRPQETSPAAASPSTAAGSVVEFHRGFYNWGCRRWRSRGTIREAISTAKREEINRASPTTPLSWSGGSGASDSACEEGWGIQKRPQKRQSERNLHEQGDWSAPQEFRDGAEMAEPSPSKRPRSEIYFPASTWMKIEAANEDDSSIRAFRSSASAPPNKETASAADPVAGSSILAVRVEPLRLRLAAEAASSAATRRSGKKKTLPELKMMEESLLRDRAELQKTLEEQKKILVALREQNQKMTKLKSDVAEEGRRGLLIDLNSLPDEEAEDR